MDYQLKEVIDALADLFSDTLLLPVDMRPDPAKRLLEMKEQLQEASVSVKEIFHDQS